MEERLDRIEAKIDSLAQSVSSTQKAVDDLTAAVAQGFKQVEEKFEVVGEQFKNLEQKVDVGFEQVGGKIDGLHRRIDGEVEVISQLETRVRKIEEAAI